MKPMKSEQLTACCGSGSNDKRRHNTHTSALWQMEFAIGQMCPEDKEVEVWSVAVNVNRQDPSRHSFVV